MKDSNDIGFEQSLLISLESRKAPGGIYSGGFYLGGDAFRRCFIQRAPQQPSFAQATKQAQALLAAAMER
jgi:hypothetical protein